MYSPNSQKPLVIDAAHSFGMKELGHRARAEVMSFSFTKPVTALQGGIILTDEPKIYEEAVELRDLSSKMCEFNAMVALNSIANYEQAAQMKRQAIEAYRTRIKVPFEEQRILTEGNRSIFAIAFENKTIRDRVANNFARNDIEVKIYYEPLESGLANTDWLFDRIIALPIYKEMIPQIPKICNLINKL